MDNLM
jgi:hypothetical protein